MAEPSLGPSWGRLAHGELPGAPEPWALGSGADVPGITTLEAATDALRGVHDDDPAGHNGAPASGAMTSPQKRRASP